MATTYKVVLHGIRDGEDPSEVVERVVALVKLPQNRVMRLLMKPGVTVKSGLDVQTAAKYEAVLERAGCNVVVAPEVPAARANPGQAATHTKSVVTTAARSGSATTTRAATGSSGFAAKQSQRANTYRSRAGGSSVGTTGQAAPESTANEEATRNPLPSVIGIKSWRTIRIGAVAGMFALVSIATVLQNSPRAAIKRSASTPTPAPVRTAARVATFDGENIQGKWLCKFRDSDGAPNELTMFFGDRAYYESVVFPGKKIQSHRIGTYQATGKRIKINVTRIPELAMTGRSTSVSIGEGIEVKSFSDREITLDQWEDSNPSDRLPMSCSRMTPPGERSASNAVPRDLTKYLGQHPTAVINDATIQQRFRSLLGSSFEAFRARLEVASELELSGDWYFGSGLAPHRGGLDMAAFAIHKASGQVYASILVDGNSIKYFGASTETELPPPLLRWQRELTSEPSTRPSSSQAQKNTGQAKSGVAPTIVGSWSCRTENPNGSIINNRYVFGGDGSFSSDGDGVAVSGV